MKKLSLICAILLLSACGSGKSSYEAPPGGGGGVTPAPPAAMIDAFYTPSSKAKAALNALLARG